MGKQLSSQVLSERVASTGCQTVDGQASDVEAANPEAAASPPHNPPVCVSSAGSSVGSIDGLQEVECIAVDGQAEFVFVEATQPKKNSQRKSKTHG